MSEVLDYVRSKDPRFKDVSDEDLTLYLGAKKPDFLKDGDFKKDYQNVVATKAVELAESGTGQVLSILTNPAAGMAAREGRKEGERAALKQQMEQTRAEAKNNAVMTGLANVAQRVVGTVAEMNPPNLLKRTLEIPAQLSGTDYKVVPALSPETVKKGIDFLDPHSYDEPNSAREGVKQAVAGFVSGLTSPDQIAALMLGVKNPEAVARMFQVEMASSIPSGLQNLQAAVKTGNKAEVTKALTEVALSAGMAGSIEAGARRAAPKTGITPAFGEAELKQAAKSAEDVAPMTAAAVKAQATQPAPTPAAKPLETPPVTVKTDTGTAPIEKETEPSEDLQAQADAEFEDQFGHKPAAKPTGDQITAASYTNPKTGKTTTGENHIEAAKAQGKKAPKVPTQRHGDEYGFEVVNVDTGEKRYVSRDEAELIARANGQLLNEPQRGKLHSDEVEFYKPEEKGKENALESETTSVLRPVRDESQQGQQKVPAEEAGKKDDEGGGGVPQEAPQLELPQYPPKPPSTQGLSKSEKRASYEQHTKALKDYYDKLKAWEEAQPQNKPILFRDKFNDKLIWAITKDPSGEWRSTSFQKLVEGDDRVTPTGHQVYPTRYEAVRSHVGDLVDKLPDVMTEEELRQKQQASTPSDAPPEQSAPAAEATGNIPPQEELSNEQKIAQNKLAAAKAQLQGLIDSGKGQSDKAFRLRVKIGELEKATQKKQRVGRASGTALRRFNSETDLNGPDILSWMQENMKMLSKTQAKEKWGKDKFKENESLYNDAVTLPPHHNVVFDSKGETPDRVAQKAFEAGLIDEPHERALWPAMEKASKARINKFKATKREAAFMAEEAKQHEDWLKATAEGEERISADQLKVGDQMEVDGERVKVTDVDADGNVTLEDGRKFGTQKLSEGQTIHVEKFEEAPKGTMPADEWDVGEPPPSEPITPTLEPAAPEPEPVPAAKVQPKTKVEERALTKSEQDEFQDLSIKARRAREEGGDPLTTEETRRYDQLTAMSGQFELLGEDSPSGIKSKISQLKEKLQQMERLRIRTQERAFESRDRRNELFKEAVTYDNEAKKVREEIRELEKQLPKEEPKQEVPAAPSETYQGAGDINPPKFSTGTKVLAHAIAGEPMTAREGEIVGTGPKRPGEEQTYFVKTNLGEALYNESQLKEKSAEPEAPKPIPEVTPQNSPTVIAEPAQKYRLKNQGPQLYSIVERMPASEIEIANGEQPVRVKNEKTGEEQVVLEGQLQAIKERTAEEKAASKGMSRRDFDDELRRLGMDPSSFPTIAQKREAIRRAKLKGPGSPSVYQGPDPKAQIEQLEESFRNIQGKKVPFYQKVKEAFDFGEKIAAGKDAISRSIAGFKAAGDYIIKQWEGYNTLDDLKRAKGELSAEVEQRGWRVRKFVKTVLKAVPDKGQRAAIAKWVDAGGDQNELHWGFMQTQPEYRQAYADAMNLSGDALTAAQNIRNFFESRLQEAMDAGVLESGVEDYIHRIYEKDPKAAQQLASYAQSGILSRNPALARKRIFQLDWEAERLGYRPVQDFLPRITAYETSLSRAIAARNFVKKVVGYTDENGNKIRGLLADDGRPVIDVAGLGIPIEDEAGVREATLINPSFKPDGNPLSNRSDYKERPEYSALRKWKWAAVDSDGKPIYVQGNVVVHPKFVERIDQLLKPSSLRFTENTVKKGLFRTAIGVSSTVKQTMLDMSGFHQVQIAVHAAEHKVLPWKVLKDIDFTDDNVDGLMKGGVTLGGEYRESHMGEGLVGRSVTRLIPGLSNVMETYHNYLFQDFIPRVKMTMALKALERNKARYAGDVAAGRMTMDEVFHRTANEANAAFGELNYTMLERSKTAQDLARIIFLAPDFLEARGRFALQALKRGGGDMRTAEYWKKGGPLTSNEQRTALFLGAVTMYTLARVANQLIDGQPHMEPENAFSIVYKNKAYSLRTVQGDILHAFEKPVQFWMSRLNPVYGRTLLELATGRDYFGRKRSPLEQIWDAVSTAYPVSLRTSQERTLWESLMNGMGVTARRYSDADEAFKLAQKWKDQHGVGGKGEFIYDSNKDPLRPLKLALSNSDDAGAVKEIKRLVDSKKMTIGKLNDYFNRYSAMPFTGSHDNDQKFFKTLTEDQKKTVAAAREHKKAIRSLYQKAREKYTSALHSKPEPDVDAQPEGMTDQPAPAAPVSPEPVPQ